MNKIHQFHALHTSEELLFLGERLGYAICGGSGEGRF